MAITPIRTPFTNMSFTPDVPSSALQATEYNVGYNVETDVRSIKSVAGDEYILSQIPGNIIFVTGGFLETTNWYFICATAQGQWYLIDNVGYSNITPPVGTFTGYNTSTVITATWNGNVVFFNDMINPPMFFVYGQPYLYLYDLTANIGGPGANGSYIWNYDVTVPTSGPQSGNIIPLYSSLTAGFVRDYNSPNVGSLLVAGNLSGEIAAIVRRNCCQCNCLHSRNNIEFTNYNSLESKLWFEFRS